jgi:hypothetical protein
LFEHGLTGYSLFTKTNEGRRVNVILEAHLNAAERRRRDERREANRLEWAAFYWQQAASHTRIADQYLERAAQLEKVSTNGKA